MSNTTYPNVFVTVGTTEFPALIEAIATDPRVRAALQRLGCRRLTVQSGSSRQRYDADVIRNYSDAAQIQTCLFDYAASIGDHIAAADLVISHAGAGTCMETLRCGRRPDAPAARKLLVVVNAALMDNHQLELAQRLQRDGYLHYCDVAGLAAQLEGSVRTEALRAYGGGDVRPLAQAIDRLMHFEEVSQ